MWRESCVQFSNEEETTHNMKEVIQTATDFGLGAIVFALHEALADDSRAPTGLVRMHPAFVVPLFQATDDTMHKPLFVSSVNFIRHDTIKAKNN